MDVEVLVPQAPVVLVPGEETRVAVEVCNRSPAPISVRLGVARSRAGAWSHLEPPVVELASSDCVPVEVVFRPPANVLPSSTLLPFTVQAEDTAYGLQAGRGTGLLTVSAPERLLAVLTPEPARRGTARYRLSLVNRGDPPLTVRVTARLDPPGGQVDVDPAVVDLPKRATTTAQVTARPRSHLVGPSSPYVVSVACRDAGGTDDLPPLATVETAGSAAPRLSQKAAAALAAAVLVLATGAAVLAFRGVDLPFGGKPAATREAGASPSPGGNPPSTPATAAVRRPYALVDVFPQQDAASRTVAEAALTRLRGAGMPVRLVDGTASDDIAEERGGFWVILQDGFSTVEAASAFCDRYRPIAPKCSVVP